MTTYVYDQVIQPPTTGQYTLTFGISDVAVLSGNATLNLAAPDYSGYGGIALAGDNDLQIAGTVLTQGAGITSGIGSTFGSTITLTSSATLRSFQSDAIKLQIGGNTVINDGFIGAFGMAVNSYVPGQNSLIDTGTIRAKNIIGTADHVKVINSGTMIATSTAILGGDQGDEITNTGLIQTTGNTPALNLGSGNDIYHGEMGIVIGDIRLGSGNDQAYGGSLSEVFDGGAGDDYIDGGAGIDTAKYIVAASVTVDLRRTDSQATSILTGADRLLNIENLVTGDGNDVLVGSDAGNSLLSGAGDDLLDGGLGDDILDGGANNDTARFSGNVSAVVDLTTTGAQNTGYGLDTLIGIENLEGGSEDDQFTGTAGDNRLLGQGGNDLLHGGLGDDVLDGGSGIDTVLFSGPTAAAVDLMQATAQATGYGSDTLIGIENLIGTFSGDSFKGNGAANTLYGNGGSDTLAGGAGNDTLVGGENADTFVFDTALSARTNKDKILDWYAQEDTILLENAVFRKLTKTGMLSKASFVVGAAAKDKNDFVGYNSKTGELWYDSNASAKGGQVVFATIGAKKTIAYSDFLVI